MQKNENRFSGELKVPEVNSKDDSSISDNQEESTNHIVQEDELLFGGDLLTNSREEKTPVQSKRKHILIKEVKLRELKSDLPDFKLQFTSS